MSFGIWRLLNGIQLIPRTGSNVDTAGEMEFSSTTNKFNVNNGTSTSPLVTESHAATLTNKSIDGGSNTITNISGASLTGVVLTTTNQTVAGDKTFTGFLGVGSIDTSASLTVDNGAALVGVNQRGILITTVFNSAGTTTLTGVRNQMSTSNTGTTFGSMRGFFSNVSKGATDTVNRVTEFLLNQSTVGAIGNAGFSDNESYSGNFFIHQSGSRTNVLGGPLLLSNSAGIVSNTATPATNGFIRLAVSNTVRWRNTTNVANNTLSIGSGSYFIFPNPSINADFLTLSADASTRPVVMSLSGAAGQADYVPLFLFGGTTTGRVANVFANSDGSKSFGFTADFSAGTEKFELGGLGNLLLRVNSTGSVELTNFLDFTQIATPSNPSALHNRLYFKSDNNLYMKNSAGTETLVNGGSGTVVMARYRMSVDYTPVAPFYPVNYDTMVNDTHSAVTTGANWKFTAPISGYYTISLVALTDTTPFAGSMFLQVNDTGFATSMCSLQVSSVAFGYSLDVAGCRTIFLNAGDYFRVGPGAAVLMQGAGGGTYNEISIVKY